MRFPRRSLLLVTVTAIAAAGCGSPEPAPEQLASMVSRVVQAGPGRDSTAYRVPSPEHAAAVAAAVTELLETGGVERLPDGYQLEDVIFGTAGHGAAEGSAAENGAALVEQGQQTPGHGLYVARPAAETRSALIVQIPHPVADQHTEELGVQLFEQTHAELFMLAGAHRDAGAGSADVAHRADSAFAAVHDAVAHAGTTVVQLHGFDTAEHDDEHGQVVLSDTTDTPAPLLRDLADKLEDAGFDTCVYNGERCRGLGATTNVQGAQARTQGAEFLHIEVSQDIRDSRSDSAELVRVIADTLREASIG